VKNLEKRINFVKSLSQFRNSFYPRIAVTVDMVATGIDIKPLECIIFMRDVKSYNYFDQMKGRGVRTIKLDDLQKVTPDAKYTKDHFIIIDAIGVTKSIKSQTQPKDLKRSVPLKDLLQSIALGCEDEELFSTLATRLVRLEKRLTDQERELLRTKVGKSLVDINKDLINAYDVDRLVDLARSKYNLPTTAEPSIEQLDSAQKDLIKEAVKPFNFDNNDLIENIRKVHEQVLDIVNLDEVKFAGWQTDNTDIQNQLITEFSSYINENKDKIIALQIFYSEPYRRKTLTYKMIDELAELISLQKPQLHLSKVYQAYLALDKVQSKMPEHKLVCLVSLLRRVIGIDSKLADYSKTVDLRFRDWIFNEQIGHNRFTDAQVAWLQMMKDHVKTSFHIDKEDFEYAPFDSHGGLGRMYTLFGDNMDAIIDNFNESMVA
jgi:type I restriction enzyme R subunit